MGRKGEGSDRLYANQILSELAHPLNWFLVRFAYEYQNTVSNGGQAPLKTICN
jgi:hypothetical protein